jgi:hypothetical protein
VILIMRSNIENEGEHCPVGRPASEISQKLNNKSGPPFAGMVKQGSPVHHETEQEPIKIKVL